ncbi:hypothetical protein [Paraburkholderia dioscoreae]|uniref:Uncharacterized protein n=1 Tax=Paraburkholderia dioscoreae TaxID=2604047 RepID=A0A5Q4Z2R5_9BURK|nr:hypothetical protein [Paraburkholderia dioscoreae]VVD30974.1 protein of unknown function [Paraburkholderia dioscoreae]
MSRIESPSALHRADKRSAHWTLNMLNPSAAELLRSAEYVCSLDESLPDYTAIHYHRNSKHVNATIYPISVLRARGAFLAELAKSAGCRDAWDQRYAARVAGSRLAEYTSALVGAENLQGAWSTLDLASVTDRPLIVRGIIEGYRDWQNSCYSEDEERFPGGEEARANTKARAQRLQQLISFLALRRALSKMAPTERNSAFSLALAARVAWANSSIALTASEGKACLKATDYADEASALAYHLGTLSEPDAMMPELVSDVAELIQAWSDGFGSYPMSSYARDAVTV